MGEQKQPKQKKPGFFAQLKIHRAEKRKLQRMLRRTTKRSEMNNMNGKPKSKKKAKKKTDAQIGVSFSKAKQINDARPLRSRVMDIVRKSGKVLNKPNKAWAKHPEKSDVKNIDDGAYKTKRRHKDEIHQVMSPMGRQGAYKTNAKGANARLRSLNSAMKDLRERYKNASSDAERADLEKRIQKTRDRMVKDQQTASKYH